MHGSSTKVVMASAPIVAVSKTFSMVQMADEIEVALQQHFCLTPTEPSDYEYAMMREGLGDWEREGDEVAEVIGWCAEIEPERSEDIRTILEERHYDRERDKMSEEGPFDPESRYALKGVDDSELQAGWRHFEDTIKAHARYFSSTAEELLRSVFGGIGQEKTSEGHPVIVEAGPGKEISCLYRARVFQTDPKLEEALKRPDQEVGPPPPSSATAGRMNAHGIAVFYGATNPDTALREVRPPIGSRVALARFDLLRPVRLLDLEALRSIKTEGS